VTNIIIEHDVVVPMRDGTRLLADVIRPDDDLPHPVILSRTIYDKSATGQTIFLEQIPFARAGYVFVTQDCRGTSSSEGSWEFFYQERDDGYDTIDWAATQPWSNGKVGIIGASGTAMVAYQAVAAQHPALAAAFVAAGAADMKSWLRRGGALTDFALGQNYLSFFLATQNLGRIDADDQERGELTTSLMSAVMASQKDLMALPVLDYQALRDERLTGGFREVVLSEPTDPFWEKEAATVGGDPSLATVPIKAIGGIHDMFLNSMAHVFSGAPAGVAHELIIGPWAHFGIYGLSYGIKSHRAAPGGAAIWTLKAIQWFDSWMKDGGVSAGPSFLEQMAVRGGAPSPTAAMERQVGGGASDEQRTPKVWYFLSGENRWAVSPSWPPEGQKLDLFLSSEGDGVRFEPSAQSGVREFTYDPADPVPTIGGAVIDLSASFNMTFDVSLTSDGVQDQRRIESRPDVLVYRSAELKEVVRIAGPVTANLWVSSSAEDTDFFVRLIDVEPDGFAGNVSEGVVRARYRNGRNDSWLTPGEPVELVVEFHDTVHSFLPGHRIQVDVTSSCFPKYSRNLNSRVVPELGHETDIAVAQQKVFDGPDTPSHITLHTVPETEPASPYM
jgi:uncharacterized protein